MTAVLADPTDDWDVAGGDPPRPARRGVRQQRRHGVHRRGRRRRAGSTCRARRTSRSRARSAPGTTTSDGDRRRAARARRPGAVRDAAERGAERRSTPINDGLRTIQFQSLSLEPGRTRPADLRRHAGQRHLVVRRRAARARPLVRDGRRRRRPVRASTRPAATIRYHNYFDATPEVNFHGDDPTTWLDDLRPAAAEPTRRARSTRRSRPTRRRRAAVHGHASTSGAPTTTAATSRR